MLNDARRSTWLGAIVLAAMAVAFLGVSFYFYGTLRHAQLGLIDDHEIIRFLGPDKAINPTDIPHILLTQTEVGQWGHALRLRPVYYFLRIIESMLWRDNGGLWYLTRMVAVASTAWGAAFVVTRALVARASSRSRVIAAAIVGFGVGCLALTMPAWSDIATRLGPSEVYVALGLVVMAIGALECYRRPERILGWVLFTLGTIIVVGSKEDGALVILPVALLYVMRFRQSRHRWVVAILGFLMLATTLYVVIGIALGTAASEADMYGNTRSVALFLQALPGDIYLKETVLFLVIALVSDIVSRRFAIRRTGRVEGTVAVRITTALVNYKLSLMAAVSVYLVLGEAFFYQNYVSTNGVFTPARYGFLSQLAAIAGVAVLCALLVRAPRLVLAGKAVLAVAVIVIVALLPPVSNFQWATQTRATTVQLRQYSEDVSAQMRASAAEVRAHPGAQVVLLIGDPLDYERTLSLPEYLSFYGTAHPVFLDVDIPRAVSSATSQFANLSQQLTSIQKSGKNVDGWLITPAAQRDRTAYTVCFSFVTLRTNPICNSVNEVG